MFGVDEGADAALLLRFGDDMQRQRRLARGFRAIDLDHAAARQAADAERDVEPERAGRDRLDLDRLLVLAQAHDRAFAERAFDLRKRGVQRLGLVHESSFHDAKIGCAHGCSPSLTVGAGKATLTPSPPFLSTRYTVCSHAQVLFLFSRRQCLVPQTEPFLVNQRRAGGKLLKNNMQLGSMSPPALMAGGYGSVHLTSSIASQFRHYCTI